jgi:hypothetical protein
MPAWMLWVLLGAAGWLVVAVHVGALLGRVVRRRERQRPAPDPRP